MRKTSDPLRVVKKLSPTQPGARKLASRYGDALLCVRYRHDEHGLNRYTTVELVVDENPIRSRTPPEVGVKFRIGEQELRARAHESGAVWDVREKLWRMPRTVAEDLGWLDRVAKHY